MASAFIRLWRRAPIWRAALLLALPSSLMTALYPFGQHEPRLPPTSAAVMMGPEIAQPALPASPPPDASPPAASPEDENEDFATTFAPFYRVPPFGNPAAIPEQVYAEREASMRPVFSVTAPFTHREIPLPPGSWTVVSIAMEPSVDDGPTGSGVLLARLEGHAVTGFVLVRGSQPGAVASIPLPPNRLCDGPRRYATVRLGGNQGGQDECWFIAEATFPTLTWKTLDVPPVLRIGIETMTHTGEQIPGFFIGATYFHATGKQWIEISYYFDTTLNGIPKLGPEGRWKPAAALADPVVHAFINRLSAWMRQRLPLLQHLGATRTPATVIHAANRNGPR